MGLGGAGKRAGGVDNDSNKNSVVCQQPQPGERRQLVKPGCWKAVAMLVLGYFAVPPAGPALARAEISVLVLAARQAAAALIALLPRLYSSSPLGCREGSAVPAAGPRRSGHRQAILIPAFIDGSCSVLCITISKHRS